MTPYTHGGDVLTARARFGGDVLDCSANLNPLGMPPAVQAAAAAAAADSARYPDPLCRALRAAIAAYDGVTRDDVIALAQDIFRWDQVSLSAVGQVRTAEEYQSLILGK